MPNKAALLFLLFIGIAYGQFNLAGNWNYANNFPNPSNGACCPITSTTVPITQTNYITTLTVTFGTGSACATAISGTQSVFTSTSSMTNLYVAALTGSLPGSFVYYPQNNTFILLFQTCEYIFTQSSSVNTALTTYTLNTIYMLSSSWVTTSGGHCCLPSDNMLMINSNNNQMTVTANYGTTNPFCYMYLLSGTITSPPVTTVGGGFFVNPMIGPTFVGAYFPANNTILLSYGQCMAYYTKMSNILAIGLSMLVGLIAIL